MQERCERDFRIALVNQARRCANNAIGIISRRQRCAQHLLKEYLDPKLRHQHGPRRRSIVLPSPFTSDPTSPRPLSPSRCSFRSSARVSRPGQAEAFGFSSGPVSASVEVRPRAPTPTCVRASGYAYKSGPPAREMYNEAEVASTYQRTSRRTPFASLPIPPPLPARAPRVTSFPLLSAIQSFALSRSRTFRTLRRHLCHRPFPFGRSRASAKLSPACVRARSLSWKIPKDGAVFRPR